MDMKVDARKIKALRLEKSWSQEELAEQASVSLRTIQRMELDGTASLKSRRAVADAFGVDPAALDCVPSDSKSPSPGRPDGVRQADQETSQKGFFSYPGPTDFGHKIRKPLLVVLWLLSMVTGGLLALIILGGGVIGALSPDMPVVELYLASIPLLVVFLVSISLYSFFKKYKSDPHS